MLIKDNYLLMLPGFFEDSLDHIALYPVDSLLALRTSDKQLTGHPSEDLGEDWLVVQFDASKAERWTQLDRLVKVKPNAREGYRVTFVERREWGRYLSAEDWQWLQMVCDCAAVFTDDAIAQRAEAENNAISADKTGGNDLGATSGKPRRKATKRGRKLTAKMRRQREREEVYHG